MALEAWEADKASAAREAQSRWRGHREEVARGGAEQEGARANHEADEAGALRAEPSAIALEAPTPEPSSSIIAVPTAPSLTSARPTSAFRPSRLAAPWRP